MTRALTFLVLLFWAGMALGHGGDGIDHTNYSSPQLPATVADTSGGDSGGGGGYNSSIGGAISTSAPTISPAGGGGRVGNGGGGEPGAEIQDSEPVPLSQPGNIANGTFRDVPSPYERPNAGYLRAPSPNYEPRSAASAGWAERGLNEHVKNLNKYLDGLHR